MQGVYFFSLVRSFPSNWGVIGPFAGSFVIVTCSRSTPVAPGPDFPGDRHSSNFASPVCFPTDPVGNHSGRLKEYAVGQGTAIWVFLCPTRMRQVGNAWISLSLRR